MNETMKRLTATIKKAGQVGVYSIWASTIKLDSQRDIIEPTAFKNLAEYLKDYPRILYNHSWMDWSAQGENTLPIGKAVAGRIIPDEGLQLDFVFSELPLASQIKYLVDNDFPMFASVGGFIKEFVEEKPSENELIRRIKNFQLIETSITPVPANDGAQFIKQLKAAGMATVKIEQALEALTKYDLRPQAGLSEKDKALALAECYLKRGNV